MNTTTTTTTKKTTQGRQKIEIKKIDNISNRQVTFSKRRAGLFKKAGELCILSGAQVAIIVKSPGKRTFAFGHPNVATVLDRYLAGKNSGAAVGGGAGGGSSPCAAANYPSAREFNERYNEVSKELEAEKRRSTEIEGSKVRNDGIFWWNETVDELGLEELEQYVASLEELKKNVAMRADEIMLMKVSTMNSSVFGLNPSVNCGGGGGLVADHFANHANHDHCGSTNSVVPLGFDFGRG